MSETTRNLMNRLEDMLGRRIGGVCEFSRFESSTIADIIKGYASYEFRRDDFAACFDDSDPRVAMIRSGKLDRVSLGELIKPRNEGSEICHAHRCGRPATRMISGKPCCDDDAHRPAPAPTGSAQVH